MDTRKTIKRMLFVAMWMVIGGGMLVLLIAAMGRQKKNTCKDYTITIKGAKQENCFLGHADVVKLLQLGANGNLKGQAKASFNLQEMERLLEENTWIKDAQLYFDNRDVLHVSVTERQPVARIFTRTGKSFYIDENERGIPLSENLSTPVPVFTGVPDKKDRQEKDSLLLRHIASTAQFIQSNPFWKSQVAQIDLVRSDASGALEFEMVPVIGHHIVKLGNGDDIAQKFNRLFIFYKQILSRTGFDRYKTIDVRFEGQVVGGRSEHPKVDSVQLRKNVDELLNQMHKMEQQIPAPENSTNKKIPDSLYAGYRAPETTSSHTNPKPGESNPNNPEPADEKQKPLDRNNN